MTITRYPNDVLWRCPTPGCDHEEWQPPGVKYVAHYCRKRSGRVVALVRIATTTSGGAG